MKERFISLLNEGKTQFHVNEICKDRLKKAGYKELSLYEYWSMEKGGKYFIAPFSSVMFSIYVGENAEGFRVTGCHTDFPMLKLKTNPELLRKGYMQANVENYGGIIKESWFDRPLGLAGKVVVASGDAFKPEVKLFDSDKAVCIIPNLAPHLKKDDKKDTIDMQKEFMPLFALEGRKKSDEHWLLKYVADSLSIEAKDILDFDLYIYNTDCAREVGLNDDFITSPRIDNLSSAGAMLEAFESFGKDGKADNCVAVGAFFDNEEIGSRSKQGADSMLLANLLEKLSKELKNVIDKTDTLMENAFYISLDVAHALHPNYQEKSDITNEVILGKGIVLKSSASQRYVSDSEAGAVIEQICRKNNIKLQRQVNRSGMPGGQTLGPIMSSYLPVLAVDMGISILAMHSASELACMSDYYELVKLVKAFYAE